MVSQKEGATAHVARFVADTKLAEVPDEAVRGAKLLMLDTIGVALAGSREHPARAVREYVLDCGGIPEATVIGASPRKAPAQMAALANGCAMNVLDYDGLWHVPTHVLPAVLAVGEILGSTGAAALEAYIVGCEAASSMRRAVDARRSTRGGPTHRGWYHVSVYGPIAAALASGKLMGFDTDRLRASIGIAANSAGGFRQNLGTSAKSLLSGNSASLGVQAALLATRGIAGDPDILEARVGLANAVCLPGEWDWEPILTGPAKPYELAGSLGLKAFPSVGPTQSVIGSLQKLLEAAAVKSDDVEWVEAGVSTFSAGSEYPDDESHAGFSWPYILAATVVDGRFGVEHLGRAKLDDERIRALAGRVKLVQPEAGADQYVSIGLGGGEVARTAVDPYLGRLETPEAIVGKYEACAGVAFPDHDTGAIRDRIMAFEQLGSVAELGEALP